ncbi:MAG: flagellar hook-associated protein FlgK [Alphaproteobacteria bacterium]
MGLSGALFAANSGLSATSASLDLVARNIANADTPGYTRKSFEQVPVAVAGQTTGVRTSQITRAVDNLLLGQVRTGLSAQGRTGALSGLLSQLDQLFGAPGAAGSLDATYNNFVDALRDLADSPEQSSSRINVLASSDNLAKQLNTLSAGIQELRQEAENGIDQAVNTVNKLLTQLGSVNERLRTQHNNPQGSAGLLDERDRLLNDISQYLDIGVRETASGAVNVSTSSGNLLVDAGFVFKLSFDANASITSSSAYDSDPTKRTLGTLSLDTGGGALVDLFQTNGVKSGIIGGLREVRDSALVEAQAQLDELAAALASTLSARDITGTAVTAGAQLGFDLDVTALKAGNTIEFKYVEGGTAKTVTLIRVDDASILPLSDDATPRTDDTVIGVDFSGGIAAAAAAISTALGAGVTVTSPSGNTLRFLDDTGGAATTTITSAIATVTGTALADEGTGLALFTDGIGGAAFTNSLDGPGQKLGFAGRITLNPLVEGSETSLVVFSTSPQTALGDATRPQELVKRLTENSFTFSSKSGIGSVKAPISENIGAFTRRVISFQTGKAADAQSSHTIQSAVTGSLTERLDSDSGVDVNTELAHLISLQNSFAANARVISAVKALMDLLVGI